MQNMSTLSDFRVMTRAGKQRRDFRGVGHCAALCRCCCCCPVTVSSFFRTPRAHLPTTQLYRYMYLVRGGHGTQRTDLL